MQNSIQGTTRITAHHASYKERRLPASPQKLSRDSTLYARYLLNDRQPGVLFVALCDG